MDKKKSPITYYIVCEKGTYNKNSKISRINNETVILKSICPICCRKKSRFIKDHYKL